MARNNPKFETGVDLYDIHEDDFEFVMRIAAPEVNDMHTPPETAFGDMIRRLGSVAAYRQTLGGETFDGRAYLRSLIRVMLAVDERQDALRAACTACLKAEADLDTY